MAKYTHIFTERGNGFPEDGERVLCDIDGDITLLRVVESSPIHTAEGGSGHGNYIYLVCKPDETEWFDFVELFPAAYQNTYHVEPIEEEAGDE